MDQLSHIIRFDYDPGGHLPLHTRANALRHDWLVHGELDPACSPAIVLGWIPAHRGRRRYDGAPRRRGVSEGL